jgi:hypothetical protein
MEGQWPNEVVLVTAQKREGIGEYVLELKEEAKRGNSLDEAKMKGPKEWG